VRGHRELLRPRYLKNRGVGTKQPKPKVIRTQQMKVPKSRKASSSKRRLSFSNAAGIAQRGSPVRSDAARTEYGTPRRSSTGSHTPTPPWCCPDCTLSTNPNHLLSCLACGKKRPRNTHRVSYVAVFDSHCMRSATAAKLSAIGAHASTLATPLDDANEAAMAMLAMSQAIVW